MNVSKQTIQYHYQRLPAENQQKDGQGLNLISLTAERIIRSKVTKHFAAKNKQRSDKEVPQGSKYDNIITDLKQKIAEVKKERDK